MGGEGGGLQKVEQTEEFIHTVLERCSRQKNTMFHIEGLESFQQLAVPVLKSVSFVYHHNTPLNAMQTTVIRQDNFVSGDNGVEFVGICDNLPLRVSMVQLIFVDHPSAICASMIDNDIEVTPRLKLSLPVGNG